MQNRNKLRNRLLYVYILPIYNIFDEHLKLITFTWTVIILYET